MPTEKLPETMIYPYGSPGYILINILSGLRPDERVRRDLLTREIGAGGPYSMFLNHGWVKEEGEEPDVLVYKTPEFDKMVEEEHLGYCVNFEKKLSQQT
jgi:hypothetical protein